MTPDEQPGSPQEPDSGDRSTTSSAPALRVVVKVGTNTIAGEDGAFDDAVVGRLADQVAALRGAGHEVILVSSGAIGAGMHVMGYEHGVQDVRVRQALAAVGQTHLVQAWERALARHGIHAGQMLLTHRSFTNRRSYLNLRNTTEELLEMGVVPVINENDTVSIDEIDASFGDNDRLSAYVAAKTEADLLVILSDVAGLYTHPPDHPDAELVPVVERIDDDIMAMAAARPGSARSRGGMRSKLDAARIATRAGTPVVIADGREPDVVTRIVDSEPVGTRFTAHRDASVKEHWLEIAKAQGRIHVDPGAATALRDGANLLPVGVTKIEGAFAPGDVVEIVADGAVVAKAMTSYASRELDRVKGARSDQVREVLGLDGSVNVTRKGDVALL